MVEFKSCTLQTGILFKAPAEVFTASAVTETLSLSNFKYPTYKNKMNRIVITANHTQEDLEKLIEILNKEL